jgi:uncharacterized membrane protein
MGSTLAAMKVPTIPTARIAIWIASFAFVFTFIVVLLWDLGYLASDCPSQVTLVMQAAYQSQPQGIPGAGIGIYPKSRDFSPY